MIEWSTGAEQQLFEIRWSFQSETALERFEVALETAIEQLETFPESARMHPSLYRQDVRAIMIGDYRMTVLLLEERILVFSMIHARSGAAFD
jgi:plasmid stabilization system protein ParE